MCTNPIVPIILEMKGWIGKVLILRLYVIHHVLSFAKNMNINDSISYQDFHFIGFDSRQNIYYERINNSKLLTLSRKTNNGFHD